MTETALARMILEDLKEFELTDKEIEDILWRAKQLLTETTEI